MTGLELSKRYFHEFGEPMMERDFPEMIGKCAFGLSGEGSECLGYDDGISRDHDYFTGFQLWITEEDERSFGFRLERAYARLRKEFPPDGEGAETGSSELGDAEDGVTLIGDFYRRHLGFPGVPENWRQWLYTPEYAFAEATNGAVFRDDQGDFSRVRAALLQMPEDVRLKKLAGHLWAAAQAAPYNYERCLARGEQVAAQWALFEFADHALSALFLLERVYRPFYKWAFRALRDLQHFAKLYGDFELLLTSPNGEDALPRKNDARARIECAIAQGCGDETKDLSALAFAVNDRIADHHIRNLNILYAV